MKKKRLIEVSLPLERISEQSAREKSIRHGHISTLHIWWARRPLAAMRAAIFASLIPAPETEKERKDLEKLIKVIVDWDQVKNGNSEAILKARRLIQDAYPDGPPKLLDPFMGGGATGLEALRLGCETHAVELNPVAHIIELCTLVYPQEYGQPQRRKGREGSLQVDEVVNPLAEDVRKWSTWVVEQAQQEIGHLYENPEGDEPVVGYMWARTVTCPNPSCRADIPLVRSWWLAKRKGRRKALKPIIDHDTKSVSFEVIDVGKQETEEFNPSNGTSSRGKATCLICSQVADAKYIRQEGREGRITETPLAVILNQSSKGKKYRPFAPSDGALFREAITCLERSAFDFPTEPIPPERAQGNSGFRVLLYGMRQWKDLFNPRQMLAVATLSQKVKAAYEAMVQDGLDPDYAKAIATYLAILVDRTADYSSSLTRWRTTVEAIAGTFGRQALPMIWDYVEINPLGDVSSWTASIDWVTKVIEHASQSSTQSAMSVRQGTATRVSYSEQYFELVVTDPPYYDAVAYADLSDFFYVWLKRTIGFLYPNLFRTPSSPKSAEIIQEPARRGGDDAAKAFYEREMGEAFSEIHRTLQEDGLFVVVFAHKSIAAWETLINSLLESGLVVTASWPLHTERPGRPTAQGTASLASSIFIVCRVRQAEIEGYFDDVRDELQKVIEERLDFFWEEGIRGADFFISAIGPAVSVFGRYSNVYKLDGSEVGVGALLDLVQELVADYALDRILNGERGRVGSVDAATRYYILHRWAYGSNDVPYDDAMRLAMALGADIDMLMDRRGVLKQSGETVKLLGPQRRGKREELGQPDRSGRIAPVVDVLHRAVVLWETGQREALARFLADNAHGREEQVRLVAQTLIDILPQDDKERRLLEGFLAGRDSVPDAPRQERLL